MALYLGNSEKLKINMAGNVFKLIIPLPYEPIGTLIVSVNNYRLKDSDGLYLTVKEEE